MGEYKTRPYHHHPKPNEGRSLGSPFVLSGQYKTRPYKVEPAKCDPEPLFSWKKTRLWARVRLIHISFTLRSHAAELRRLPLSRDEVSKDSACVRGRGRDTVFDDDMLFINVNDPGTVTLEGFTMRGSIGRFNSAIDLLTETGVDFVLRDMVFRDNVNEIGAALRIQGDAPGAVAIDAGTNTGCPASDQRAASRPFDGDGDEAAVCDVGAFEASDIDIFADGFESGDTDSWSSAVP